VKAYKSFDKDFCCKRFQYGVGKSYEFEGKIKLCEAGFHACLEAQDVLDYYVQRFAIVELEEVSGERQGDSKIVGKKITILEEITIEELAKHCYWNKLDGLDWSSLLQRQPQFAKHCNWYKLDGFNWIDLLQRQPQLAKHCSWDKLDGFNWIDLLQRQPQFAEYCSWDKLDGTDWSLLLRIQPQFAKHCSWNKLNDTNWSWLLWAQPQFAKYRSWNKLKLKVKKYKFILRKKKV